MGRSADIQRRAIAATLAVVQGNAEGELATMREAAALEDEAKLSSIAPGPLVPARELLAGMLLSLKQPGDARKAYETALTHGPNRFWSLDGAAKAAQMSGDKSAARASFKQLLVVAQRADRPGRQTLAKARTAVRP